MTRKTMRTFLLAACLPLLIAGVSAAQTVYDSPVHVFSTNDVLGGTDGVVAADDPTIICSVLPCAGEEPIEVDGQTLYPVDSNFTYDAIDFVAAFVRERDGVYEEGWVGNYNNPSQPELQGLWVANAETTLFKAGFPKGRWCAGLGGVSVKCESEHFTVMEHVLTCDETVPYYYYDPVTGLPVSSDYSACEELDVIPDGDIAVLPPNENSVVEDIAVGTDYSVTLKDDGKALYRWGTLVKRPTDVRLYARIPLPAEWSVEGVEYEVLVAELEITHLITNNPNDQVKPEDFENEAATGRKPAFVETSPGVWISTVDCYESDGDLLPATSVLRNAPHSRPDAPSSDLREGLTNAWYTSLDRDPFEADPVTGKGPRWRLKANKFGQDIPGLEIPLVNCSKPPYSHGNIKYPTGQMTTTTINLLDWADGETSPLASNLGWRAFLDGEDGPVDGLSPNGLPLTDDFDLAIYIKGDRKPTAIFTAQLHIIYQPVPAL